MRKLVLHIPHSSVVIPFREGYTVSDEIILGEILKLTDWYTNDLFYSENVTSIIAGFSRVFCDAERFDDDSKEKMAESGMGVLYEKSDEGGVIRNVTTELRDKILNGYYYPHHSALKEATEEQITNYGNVLIVDCHSFPDIPFKRDLNQNPNRPDFNIGTDDFHTSKNLTDLTRDFFTGKGFSVGIDEPYAGTIVPAEFYRKSKEVQSIMIEVNRRLYLKGETNEKSNNYGEVKKVIGEFLEKVFNFGL